MKQQAATFWRLLKLALPVKNAMLLATLLGALTIGSGVALMATSAYLISAAALHPSVAVLQVAIVGVRFFGIARGVFRYVERLVSHSATFRLLTNLRTWFYRALEPLVPARLLTVRQGEQVESGDLLRRVVADIDLLQNFYIRIIAPPAVALLIGLGTWLLLGAFNPLLALVFALLYLLASVVVPLLSHLLSRHLGAQQVETRARLHAFLVDSVQGLADLAAFNQEERQTERIQQLNARLNKLQMAQARVSGIQGALSSLLLNLTGWLMLLLAIPLVSAGQINGVFLALLVLTALASFEGVLPLPGAFQQLGASLAAAQRLFEIVDAPPAVQPPPQPAAQPSDYRIEARALSFRYAPEEPEVLHDISFNVSQNRCMAIVGPSGSGKSTLAHLLLRYWDYEHGHILLGDQELRNYEQDDLYRLVSVVEQDTYLFNTTIRENLLLARPDASEEELIQAARQAQLHDFVLTLPDGYETRVGEQGLRLSGGERQRIAIARAFLKDAPILILDEPTVNLDAIAERAVLDSIRTLRTGRTTILITHRLSALDMADEILVLQGGQSSERGSHEALLQAEGLYCHMWIQQSDNISLPA